MKTALVVGATGLIGHVLTIKLLESKIYSKIKVLTRKPLSIQHPDLEQMVVDFDKMDTSKIVADDIFCCLGTTMANAGSKEAFYQVDFIYPLEVAKIALVNGASQFAIVTALGASSKSSVYYNRVKGDIEAALTNLGYKSLLIFRPSLLLGDRKEERMGEKIGTFLAKAFSFLIPKKYKGIQVVKIAHAMIALSQQNLIGKHIVESDVLQDY